MHAENDPALEREQRRMAAKIRATLEENPVDAVTAARLSAARHRALDARRKPRRAPLWAGAALAACAVVALTLGMLPRLEPTAAPELDADSLEWIALAEEAPEFYEALEFYEWLDAETRDG